MSFSEAEELMSEDPDDRAIRMAHGFARKDDFTDPALVCRNGCGLTYEVIVGGKVRECAATKLITP